MPRSTRRPPECPAAAATIQMKQVEDPSPSIESVISQPCRKLRLARRVGKHNFDIEGDRVRSALGGPVEKEAWIEAKANGRRREVRRAAKAPRQAPGGRRAAADKIRPAAADHGAFSRRGRLLGERSKSEGQAQGQIARPRGRSRRPAAVID